MRLITIQAPDDHSSKIYSLAFAKGIDEVSIRKASVLKKDGSRKEADFIELETNTPKAKEFIEAVMQADFFDPQIIHLAVRHPESIIDQDPPEEETYPMVRPNTDIYEELWQFSQISLSLLMRVVLSALLVAYGMKEAYLPLVIAGLLFLPYHHHLLAIALSGSLRNRQLLFQALKAFILSTAMIVMGGVLMGLLLEPHIKFTAFYDTPILYSFIISIIIGTAAGFGGIDDAGRRELIGLAATAHLAIYPVWFGLKFIFGFDSDDKPLEFLLVFLMDVITITFFSFLVFKIMRVKGVGINRFVKLIKKES